MSIKVICPGCHARFKVSDRFAGQSGACPKCKATINVPAKTGEIKVHEPRSSHRGGPGVLTLRPIARRPFKLAPGLAIGISAATVAAIVGAWLAGGVLQQFWLVRAIGVLLISPPLALAGYYLVHNDEHLDLFSGTPLVIRTAICAAAYAALWAVFGYTSDYAFTGDLWCWLVAAPPFIITGGLVALACYDLDFGTGCLHYSFYLLFTILLRGCAGLGWIWQIRQMG